MITLKMIKDMDNRRNQRCSLERLDVRNGEHRVLKTFSRVIEAPNWTSDGKTLIFNSRGLIYRYLMDAGNIEEIPTGEARNCNNDHVLSPDGASMGISNFDNEKECISRIYTLPLSNGAPRLVTAKGPSYLHGWSPDGRELAFCGERNCEYNIYTIALDGTNEKALTSGTWLDDGPEYSPCGRYIWFNSTRSGLMQIWRMNRDGSEPMQMTHLDRNCWFPHVSPNGKNVVFIAYRKGDLKPDEHLPDLPVEIWIMDISGNHPRLLTSFIGGQGSINVNSWSPDSRKIAYVTY